MNHTVQGLSNGTKGAMKQYLEAICDYGSGFMGTLMGSNLVHLMLVGKYHNLLIILG